MTNGALSERKSRNAIVQSFVYKKQREVFNNFYIWKIAPKWFYKFAYSPSEGASGGILDVWNSSLLLGTLVHNLSFALTVSFTSIHSAEAWTLTTVYGPCQDQLRDDFITWLHDIDIPDNSNWLFLGDFNFYRSTGNMNKPGGNLNDIFIFNEVISHLGLLEIPIKGRALT